MGYTREYTRDTIEEYRKDILEPGYFCFDRKEINCLTKLTKLSLAHGLAHVT